MQVVSFKNAVRWLDQYTSPRPETAGNMDKPSYFQAMFNGAADGLYLSGPVGLLSGAASAASGIAVQRATHSQIAGVAAGALVGGALGAAVTCFMPGPTKLVATTGGALLGAFETLRGDAVAKHRDASNLFPALFLRGPAKLAGSAAGMVAAHVDNPWAQTALGAATGALLGGAVACVLPTGVSVPLAMLVSGIGGGLAPFGARTSQFLRNLAQDVGKALPHSSEHPSSKTTQILGTIPVAFAREGLHAFLMSDGNWGAVLVGGLKESVKQGQVVLASSPPHNGT